MKKRLFFGVDISAEARKCVAVYIDELAQRFPSASAKWERPENLHITLKFLGGVDEERVARLTTDMERAVSIVKPFSFELVTTGVFPSLKNPRVLWLGINEPTLMLRDLASRVDNACSELGFESESREFRPHLTIARLRESNRVNAVAKAHAANKFGPIQCPCGELVLFESRLGGSSSVYTKLATTKLRIKSPI